MAHEVRAKFYVKSATSSQLSVEGDGPLPPGGAPREDKQVDAIMVTLEGVNRCCGPNHDDEDEDSMFGKYTPHGEISMTITAESGGRYFAERVGKKVYVDFSDAE